MVNEKDNLVVAEILNEDLLSWFGVLTEEKAATLMEDNTSGSDIHLFLVDWREAAKYEPMIVHHRAYMEGR